MPRWFGTGETPVLLAGIIVCLLTTCLARADVPYYGTQSALNPAGATATNIDILWWRTFWLLTAIYVIVVILALIPMFRDWGLSGVPPEHISPTAREERRLITIVSSAVGITTMILFVLLFGDFRTGIKNRSLESEADPLTISVIGHQWWWDIAYQDPKPNKWISDANEIHIPVNRPVRLDLSSADVIHSFWAPNLSGKKDLVPGHPTSLTIRAQRTGTYWAQCAEYCGYQHAHMRLAVIVQTPEEYQAWAEAARQPAPTPVTELQKRGMQVFMGRTCSMCHTIQGTRAGGRLGPGLTHIASRATIAAGSLPNTMGHLGGWIVDPQGIKPGTNMPQNALSADDLQAVLEYLESLK
ncbi:MAG TPA: cytochrome c oxidase subunit II [Tepidisphaeraceae bacterium]|nr:cytochrome c oxidase subunit II [Tepidisphaeraceae bacterium]